MFPELISFLGFPQLHILLIYLSLTKIIINSKRINEQRYSFNCLSNIISLLKANIEEQIHNSKENSFRNFIVKEWKLKYKFKIVVN